ncbi:MAG: ribosome biogenesis GTPase Der [Bacillota bacterium]
MKSVVAIVGRPNVGKSTLFNRLIGARMSITDRTPGVTRDRIYGEVEWTGREFVAVDTGGWEDDRSDLEVSARQLSAEIRRQAEIALDSADAAVLVVDGRAGLTALDEMMADLLRSRGLATILAVNKMESRLSTADVSEFYSLGLGEPVPISAEHGHNTGDLLDAVVAALPPDDAVDEGRTDEIRVAIVGRPNVGKSSLLNTLLRDDRVLVSEQPGTTRDAVEVAWTWEGHHFRFVDTAGLRRRSRVEERLEWHSVSRALRAVRQSDVVLLLLDAQEMVTEQDQRIASFTRREGKAAVIAVNKWDLVEAERDTWNDYVDLIRQRLYFVDYASAVSISALTGQRIMRLPEMVLDAHRCWKAQVPTAELNRTLRVVLERHQPPASRRGRKLRLYYVTQVANGPPTFLLFANDPRLITENYRRYLDRALRAELDLAGTPIRLLFRRSE